MLEDFPSLAASRTPLLELPLIPSHVYQPGRDQPDRNRVVHAVVQKKQATPVAKSVYRLLCSSRRDYVQEMSPCQVSPSDTEIPDVQDTHTAPDHQVDFFKRDQPGLSHGHLPDC